MVQECNVILTQGADRHLHVKCMGICTELILWMLEVSGTPIQFGERYHRREKVSSDIFYIGEKPISQEFYAPDAIPFGFLAC